MDFDRIKQALKLNKWPVISIKEQLKEEQKKRIERIWSAFVEDGIVKSCHRIPSRLAYDEELLRCHQVKRMFTWSSSQKTFSEKSFNLIFKSLLT